MKHIEIEIQVEVDSIAELEKFLESKAKKEGTTRQIDEYFIPAHRDFLATKPVEEWLRLRDAQGKQSINYKHWHYDPTGKSSHCDEYETEVKDLESLHLIFAALNVRSLIKVDKTRTIYLFEDFEISLDQVASLGDFIEIEYKGEGEPNEAGRITDRMIAFLKEHNVGKIYRNFMGYPYQLLFPEDIKRVEV